MFAKLSIKQLEWIIVNPLLSHPAIICSKLTIKTPERRHWRLCGVFIVNFEYISHLVLVFLLLTLRS